MRTNNTFIKLDNTTKAVLYNKKDLTLSTLKVYLELCNYSFGDKNECYPTQITIANRCNISEASVKRSIKWLETNGFICVEKHKNHKGFSNNLYKIMQQNKRTIKGAVTTNGKYHINRINNNGEEVIEVEKIETEEYSEEPIFEVACEVELEFDTPAEETVNELICEDINEIRGEGIVKAKEEDIITGAMIRNKLTQINKRMLEIFCLDNAQEELDKLTVKQEQLSDMIKLLDKYDVATWNEVLELQKEEE